VLNVLFIIPKIIQHTSKYARDVIRVGHEGLVTSITGTEEQRAALPQTTPEKERDAFVIAPRWRVFGRQSNASVWDWASLLLSSLEVAGNDLTFKPFSRKLKASKSEVCWTICQPKCNWSCSCNQQAYLFIPTLPTDIASIPCNSGN